MSDGTWIAVALSSVAMIGTALAAWTARKTTRDKLEFDAELIELKAHHETCQETTAEMKRELEQCREEHKASKVDRAALDARLSAIEEKLS